MQFPLRLGATRDRRRLLSAAAFFAAAALPAAASAAQSERLAYTLMLGGLHIGDAVVALDQTDAGYRTEMKVAASGAMRFVKDFRATMEGAGRIAGAPTTTGPMDMKPVPATYKREWTAGTFAEAMTMTFDPATRTATTEDKVYNPVTGEGLTHEDLPWNKHSKLKPVPANLRTNVLDPMAAFVAGREQLIAGGAVTAPSSFRVPIYDGSRRYDVIGRSEPMRSVSIDGTERQVIPVVGQLEPVFGFTKESEDKLHNITGKIYFTADARFLPVQMLVSADVFSVVMNITADCHETPAACAALDDGPPGQRAQAP